MLATQPKDKNEEKVEKTKSALVTAPVVKVIEVIGTSEDSFDDAITRGITTAAHSLRHITGADIKHLTVAVRDGAISHYKVDLKIAFALEGDTDD